jgi:hypothetical protein
LPPHSIARSAIASGCRRRLRNRCRHWLTHLFDHLVGECEQRRRTSRPNGPCGLDVDEQLEPSRKLHQQAQNCFPSRFFRSGFMHQRRHNETNLDRPKRPAPSPARPPNSRHRGRSRRRRAHARCAKYKRHGTVSLLAGIDLVTGKVHARRLTYQPGPHLSSRCVQNCTFGPPFRP